MTANEPRRPLEDMISELVEGVGLVGRESATGLRPSSVEFSLPIEMRVIDGPSGLAVHADMPATRTPTAFDLPVGRLKLHLTTVATRALP
jgi:hypothetical protein